MTELQEEFHWILSLELKVYSEIFKTLQYWTWMRQLSFFISLISIRGHQSQLLSSGSTVTTSESCWKYQRSQSPSAAMNHHTNRRRQTGSGLRVQLRIAALWTQTTAENVVYLSVFSLKLEMKSWKCWQLESMYLCISARRHYAAILETKDGRHS